MSNRPPLKVYEVILSQSPSWRILARDSEQAAWSALELANAKDDQLVNVRPIQDDEW